MDRKCLIGYTGFIGSNLKTQLEFNEFYNTQNINEIKGDFDLVVCSAAPAIKWYANLHPEEDEQNIKNLIEHLKRINSKKFILISTIDVYSSSENQHEGISNYEKTSGYGKNRRTLEEFATNHFKNIKIIRLPGMFGKGLKKNIIFDLCNNNHIDKINLFDEFQWYNVENLWKDITKIPEDIHEINFFTEPISNKELIESVFPEFNNIGNSEKRIAYNNRSLYFSDGYIQKKQEVIKELKEYKINIR
jgi:nucleoside-diphosphate-sugar epimerase